MRDAAGGGHEEGERVAAEGGDDGARQVTPLLLQQGQHQVLSLQSLRGVPGHGRH